MLDVIICENGFRIGDCNPSNITEKAFAEDRYRAFYTTSFNEPPEGLSQPLGFIIALGRHFSKRLVSAPDVDNMRERIALGPGSMVKILASVPFMPGSEYINPAWIMGMWDIYLQNFRSDISKYAGTVESYFSGMNAELTVSNKLFFHLVENRKDPEHPFAFLATYSSEPIDGRPNHQRLINALQEFGDDPEKLRSLLSPLISISERSPFISQLMDSGEIFHPIRLGRDEAFSMLRETEMYRSFGVHCRIPNWWRTNRNGTLSITFANSGGLNAGSLMSCTPEICLGGSSITPEEARAFLQEKESLVLVRGGWAEIDHERLRVLLERYELLKSRFGDRISIFDAMRMLAGFDQSLEGMELGVTNEDWLSSLSERVGRSAVTDVDVPKSFVGELREYQRTGLKWLTQLSSMDFGACLADDMGLGKTVQVLAYLDSRRMSKERTLLIVPASLIGNWMKECERFTPELSMNVVHGRNGVDEDSDVNVTTYATLLRKPELAGRTWDNVILDEAQNIKNPYAKQTAAVKRINGRFRLALTGTPVENRLSDLWSVFDYINPGLLGTSEEFDDFSRRISESGRFDRLREMISPFILRRMKSDRRILSDLPEKIEKNEYVDLTRKQVTLYRALMDDLDKALADSDPAKRLGALLAMITRFKQVCNHPDNYLHGTEFDPEDSGKMMMLAEICQRIRDRNESVIVFTQYREMVEPISKHLAKIFGKEGMTIHGGVPPERRADMVARFNSEDEYVPFMVLSLKTGGFGLNLVSANHVIHFDRWWNPSVENQATDRAYRIGQRRNVMVHKFVCRGTIEEKIDRMISGKNELAGNVVPSEERWLNQMSNDEIYDLFRLE